MNNKEKKQLALGIGAALVIASAAVALLYDDKKNYKKLKRQARKASKNAQLGWDKFSAKAKDKYSEYASVAKDKYQDLSNEAKDKYNHIVNS